MDIQFLNDFNAVPSRHVREFFSNQEGVCFFQSEHNARLAAGASESLCVIACDRGLHIRGVICGAIQRFARWPVSLLASRIVVIGGPVLAPGAEEVFAPLLREFISASRGKGAYIEIRNTLDRGEERGVFRDCGFTFESHFDILFDLRSGVESLWKKVHPTRRKQINRARKRNVCTRILNGNEEALFNQAQRLVGNVYRRIGLPCPNQAYFRNAFHQLTESGNLQVFCGFCEGEVIGTRMVLCYQGTIFDWYAGSDPSHSDKYVNDLLSWEVIRWGAENGFRSFDFGGAGKPGIPYGVRDYKLKFGGQLIDTGRFTYPVSPLFFRMGSLALRGYRKVRATNFGIPGVKGKGAGILHKLPVSTEESSTPRRGFDAGKGNTNETNRQTLTQEGM